MNIPTLSQDISMAIHCMQEYRENHPEYYDEITGHIERLFSFYYQLIGFKPNQPEKK